MCHGFLSTGEVLWLRRLFSAHQGWAMYNWGSVGKNGGVGKNGDLASMLERIDFGPAEMQARCSEMHRSPATPPHGRLQPYPTGATPSLHDTPHQAEGVAAAKSFIQPVGELRQACSLVITPRRHDGGALRGCPVVITPPRRHHPTCVRAAAGRARCAGGSAAHRLRRAVGGGAGLARVRVRVTVTVKGSG